MGPRVGETEFRLATAHRRVHVFAQFQLLQPHPDLRITSAKPPDHLGKRIQRERGERDQVQPAGHQPGHVAHRCSTDLQLAQRPARGIDQRVARRGELNAARQPMEEFHAQLAFEDLDRMRQGGLRYVQRISSCGESTVVHHGEEVL